MGHTEEPNSILGKLFFLLKLPSEDFQQTVKLRASTSPWESRLWTFRFRQRERERTCYVVFQAFLSNAKFEGAKFVCKFALERRKKKKQQQRQQPRTVVISTQFFCVCMTAIVDSICCSFPFFTLFDTFCNIILSYCFVARLHIFFFFFAWPPF